MDCQDYKKIDFSESWDLFVGIATNFDKIARQLKDCQKIMFAVNAAPVQRQQIVGKALIQGISISALQSEDGIYSFQNKGNLSNSILLLGNSASAKNYRNFVNESKPVIPITVTFSHTLKNPGELGNDILYYPGTLSVRKGITVIAEFLRILNEVEPQRKIILVGRTKNQSLHKKVQKLADKFPNQLDWYEEFMDEDSNEWNTILAKTAFAVFPSFEEGIPATVGELVSSGIPVLYSDMCGLNFPHDTEYFVGGDMEQNRKVFESFLSKSNTQLQEFHKLQQAYLNSLSPLSEQLERIFCKFELNFNHSPDEEHRPVDASHTQQDMGSYRLVAHLTGPEPSSSAVQRILDELSQTHFSANRIELVRHNSEIGFRMRSVFEVSIEHRTISIDIHLDSKVSNKEKYLYYPFIGVITLRDLLFETPRRLRMLVKLASNKFRTGQH